MGKKSKITARFVSMPEEVRRGKHFDEKKKRPQWAEASGGSVPFTKFAKAWQSSGSVEAVQKKYFWMTTEQLKKERNRHNRYIRSTMVGVVSLKNLKSEADRWKENEKKMKDLVEAGVLVEKKNKEEKDVGTSTIDRTGVGSTSTDIDHMNDAPPPGDLFER